MPRGRTLSLLALLLVHRGADRPRRPGRRRAVGGRRPAAREEGRPGCGVAAAQRARRRASCVSEGGGYACASRPGASTPSGSRRCSARGRAELARGEPLEAAATLRQALALWRGPALADVSDERFAQPEIARLEDLRLACLGDRLDADLALGRHAEVAGELEGSCGSIRCASGSAASRCSPSTAPAARPTRSRRTAARTPRSSTGSASSRRRSCGRSRPRSCARTSRHRPARRRGLGTPSPSTRGGW